MTKRTKPGKQRNAPSPGPGLGRPVRRRAAPRLLMVATVAVVLIGCCVAGVLWWAGWLPSLVGPTSGPHAEISPVYGEALQVAGALREDFPKSSDPLVLMGNLYHDIGDSAEAAACWRQAISIDPRRADAYRGLGLIAVRQGHYQEALEFWEEALKIAPQMGGVRTFSARALMALGRPDEAVAALKQDLQLSPDASTTHFELGQAYRQLKEYEKAKESYRAALRLRRGYTNAYYGLALACERLGEKDEAAAYMKEFQRLKAQNRQVDRDRRSTYDDVASAHRTVAETCTDAAQVYFGHGEVEKAEKLWRKAAELDPQNTPCRMQLVNLYMQDERDVEALQTCEELSRIDPSDPVTYINIGVLNARLRRFEAALSAVDRAIQLDPGNVEYRKAREKIEAWRRRDGSDG